MEAKSIIYIEKKRYSCGIVKSKLVFLYTGEHGFNVLPDVRLPGAELQKRSKDRSTPYERAKVKYRSRIKDNQKKDKIIQEITEQKDTAIGKLKEELQKVVNENERIRQENEILKERLKLAEEQVKQAEEAARKAKEELDLLKSKQESKRTFSYVSINDSVFNYLTGLTKPAFHTFFDLFVPFLHLIDSRKKLSKRIELFAVLIMLRHGLEGGIVAWIVDVSPSTMSKVFESWVVFGSAVFSKIDLNHPKTLIENLMPKTFVKNGMGNVVLVLDATEFKLTNFSDLQLNSVFFSNYKNTHTAKGLIGITPHGALCQLPDLYPGSISDNDISVQTGALDHVFNHDCILTDKGFGLSEEAAEKGAIVNRPPMATCDQFTSGEVDATFKTAHLRIHVERWIGRLRNYSILNKVWHSSRLDLLNETVKFCAHLVNIMDLVGPKE